MTAKFSPPNTTSAQMRQDNTAEHAVIYDDCKDVCQNLLQMSK